MPFIGETSIRQGAAGATADSYEINQSIRFNDNDSAYMSRTFASAGNRKTWTWSGWVKRGNILSADSGLFCADASGSSNEGVIEFDGSNNLKVRISGTDRRITTQVFRDPSAWYHIVVALDTTQANGADRIKVYVNGSQITSFSTSSDPTQNSDCASFNNANIHTIGRWADTANFYHDGYMAEINFIDGQALAPTDFGKTNNNGVWVPKAYTGAYGTNGFYITGEDSADLGADYSGNGNDFTSSGLASDDQMLDTPTDNYATFSPINLDAVTLSNGNLFCGSAAFWSGAAATIALPNSGKWYIETLVGNRFGSYQSQGFVPANIDIVDNWAQALYYGSKDSSNTPNYALGMNGANNGDTFGFYAASGTTIATVKEPDGSVLYSTNALYICHALDLDNERYWVGTAFVGDSNVTWFGPSGSGADPETPATGLDISAYLAIYGDYGLTFFHSPSASSGSPSATVDFGQSGYTFTKPDGFNTVSTANLPGPAIADGSAYFQTTLYTGNGTAIGSGGNPVSQSGNRTFRPDFVWIKRRDSAVEHVLTDAVRGVTEELSSNDTGAEETVAEGLTTFGSSGFTVGSDGSYNTNTGTYAAWQWLAGNGTASNTDGSITSTVSANQTAGFSIVGYTGNATSGATVGHGLGLAPDVIIVKNRDASDAWQVYHSGVASDAETDYLVLNTTAAVADNVNRWNDTAPTSSLFSLGNAVEVNTNTEDYVAYCFAEVEGFSKFGAYTGNGSADGAFVWCGFSPAFVVIKRSDSTGNWTIFDNQREGYNVDNDELVANTTAAETTTDYVDIVSNGFKLRSSDADINASGGIYIFMAFAEQPFGGDGVAPTTAR